VVRIFTAGFKGCEATPGFYMDPEFGRWEECFASE
jgi:hypothetical protein